jgi:hypothetical protein
MAGAMPSDQFDLADVEAIVLRDRAYGFTGLDPDEDRFHWGSSACERFPQGELRSCSVGQRLQYVAAPPGPSSVAAWWSTAARSAPLSMWVYTFEVTAVEA